VPTKVYRAADGRRIPSVTTVLGHRKSAEGLIHWGWKEGIAGRDYRQTRDEAADKGSIVHAMIERHIGGLDPFEGADGSEIIDEDCLRSFGAFAEWFDGCGFKLVASEVSLISERHRYGGTLDSMMIIEDGVGLAVGDWKTSASVYSDFCIQVAAYAALWDENHPGRPITSGAHLLRFGKDGEREHVRMSMDLVRMGFEAFLKLKDVYYTDQALEKAIRAERKRAKAA